MSQGNYVIENLAGAGFRAAINEVLAAIVTNNSGATEPVTTYAHQWWVDTAAGILKRRNAGNTAWISVMSLSLAITEFAEDLLSASDDSAVRALLGVLPVDGSSRMTGDLALSAGKSVVFEGATEDAFETTLMAADPTADRTLQLPNKSGVLALVTDVPLIPRHISGLQVSTAGSSNTITVSAGIAASVDETVMMRLASAISKTTSSWVVGSGNGGLDVGVIANNTWYHIYEIQRADTGIVDVIFSLSPTSPMLPANYTKFRHIGVGLINAIGQWRRFFHDGDDWTWETPTLDIDVAGPGAAAVSRVLAVPTGIPVIAKFNYAAYDPTNANGIVAYFSDLRVQDLAPSNVSAPLSGSSSASQSSVGGLSTQEIRTNVSAQVRSRISIASGTAVLKMSTLGWSYKRSEV